MLFANRIYRPWCWNRLSLFRKRMLKASDSCKWVVFFFTVRLFIRWKFKSARSWINKRIKSACYQVIIIIIIITRKWKEEPTSAYYLLFSDLFVYWLCVRVSHVDRMFWISGRNILDFQCGRWKIVTLLCYA